MEADCSDYIDSLSDALKGNLALVLSVGERNDGQANFEFADAPAPTGSCVDNFYRISVLKVETAG